VPRPTEVFTVLAFLTAIAAVYVAAARILYRRWRRDRTPLRRRQMAIVTAAILGLVCMLYGRFVEPRWPEVTETRVATSRLPGGHRGVRLVHLSDLHSEAAPLLEADLPARVAELRPDVIVFTGDSANSDAGVAVFRECLTSLAKIAPTYAVRGNWDVLAMVKGDQFAGTGATVLTGTSASLQVSGATVHMLGAGYGGDLELLNSTLAALPADGPAVVLFHLPYPDIVTAAVASRVDLMCSGHTHGGQVALPFYGALLTLSKHGKRFERGFYPNADGFGFPLYVSRGIGMGGVGPRVRFCSRPEIAVIDLVPQA
jgi:predicted MPP superfamily phosphohydrolase